MKTTTRPPPAYGFLWGVPWLIAVLGAFLLWAGITNGVIALIGAPLAFFLVPLFVPKPEGASGVRTFQLTSLVLAVTALGGALALRHDAPLEALKAGLRAVLEMIHRS